MELVLKTDSEEDVEQILALARKLNIPVETVEKPVLALAKSEELENRIRAFKAKQPFEGVLSDLLMGSIDREKGAKLNQELENMRNEWERDIF